MSQRPTFAIVSASGSAASTSFEKSFSARRTSPDILWKWEFSGEDLERVICEMVGEKVKGMAW